MDTSRDESPLIEQLAEEVVRRQRRGERPSLEEYVQRYPDLADEIREVFPALRVMEQVAPNGEDLNPRRDRNRQPTACPLKQIGDYRILREISRGGMGVVYEAEQQSLRRRVALKVLPSELVTSGHGIQRFEREARAAARMHHTNIVPVFDVGREGKTAYYAMQLIHGQALDRIIGDLKRLRHQRRWESDDLSKEVASHGSVSRIAASLMSGRFRPVDLAEGIDGDRSDSEASLLPRAVTRKEPRAEKLLIRLPSRTHPPPPCRETLIFRLRTPIVASSTSASLRSGCKSPAPCPSRMLAA